MNRFLRHTGLQQTIRALESALLQSRYKYVVRPLRYDGTETELAAEITRLYTEIAKHTHPLWEIKDPAPFVQPLLK
jgi:hypothetical protein